MTGNSRRNLTRLTQSYIIKRPSVKECLRSGLINHSALAREICREYQVDHFDAVLKAAKRFGERLNHPVRYEEKITNLLKRARIEIKSKMVVATVLKGQNLEKLDELQRKIRADRGDFNVIEGSEAFTVITNERYVPLLKGILRKKIKRLSSGAAVVSMILSPSIEKTPGVVSFVFGLLAERGINIREEMSCWTDIMFVVDEQDLSGVVECLKI